MPSQFRGDTLGRLQERGVTHLRLICVNRLRSIRHCIWEDVIPIDGFIARHGPGARPATAAREARCRWCGALGTHIQPEPPARGRRPGGHHHGPR